MRRVFDDFLRFDVSSDRENDDGHTQEGRNERLPVFSFCFVRLFGQGWRKSDDKQTSQTSVLASI